MQYSRMALRLLREVDRVANKRLRIQLYLPSWRKFLKAFRLRDGSSLTLDEDPEVIDGLDYTGRAQSFIPSLPGQRRWG